MRATVRLEKNDDGDETPNVTSFSVDFTTRACSRSPSCSYMYA